MLTVETISNAFKTSIDSKKIELNFLTNGNGLQVGICNYGARITHFRLSDKNQTDIVLGFNSIQDYFSNSEFYHGVTVGVFANRIKNAKFILEDIIYQLEANNGNNSLHSGASGFHNKVWDIVNKTQNAITLKTVKADGQGGFPGELGCTVTFTLNNENELQIDYSAVSDKNTVINLTNHAYFNLNGEGSGNILNHDVEINANVFVEIDKTSAPTGKLLKVDNTPFDFRIPKKIGAEINSENQQLLMGNGYDHSFELNKEKDAMSLAAKVKGNLSGIALEVYTTEPAVQFYTGNFLDGKDKGKSGFNYQARDGFCLETQHHPDSPNQPQFPSTFLAAQKEFKSSTIYKVILPN